MANERWLSDMRGHHPFLSDLGPGTDDRTPTEGMLDNVLPLFAPHRGTIAGLIAAASGPAELHELRGESEIRAAFRLATLEKGRPARRRVRWAPVAIAASSVAGLVAGTAGLSAAAVLPPAANQVVAKVLSQVGIDVAPKASLSANSGSSTPPAPRPAPPAKTPPSASPASTPPSTVPAPTRRAKHANTQACAPGSKHKAAQIDGGQSDAVFTALADQSLPACPPATARPAKTSGTGSSSSPTGTTGSDSGTGTGTGTG
ncbi:MAG TPA: hypothetical protein VIJ09_14370, partial [Acidimicrobiales bacterium]